MRQELRERYCSHRGDLSAGPGNSYEAIKASAEQDVVYVEFDVMYIEGSLWTGHPPSEPIDELERILPLFEDNETFLKIDLKFGFYEEWQEPIDTLLSLLGEYTLDFVLINLGGRLKGERMNEAQLYFAEQVKDRDNLKLNIALQCHRPYGEPVSDELYLHFRSLGDLVWSVSPELFMEDHDAMGKFAQGLGIAYVIFWITGLPNEPTPWVSEATLLKTLELEEKYDIKVLFDINQGYVSEEQE